MQATYISVIPGRAKSANPESSSELGRVWIPGPTLRVVPE